MKNAVEWFEIPVANMARACTFYSAVLGDDLQMADMGGTPYAFFPVEQDQGGVGGALVETTERQPSTNGALVYLSGGDDLSGALSRVEKAGGKVVTPKTFIGEGMGYFAHFLDTEGNQVGLFSMQ